MPVAAADEFRALFEEEARLRLDRLNELVMALEHAPGDVDLVKEIFREAHTLKGAAAVVALDEVRDAAHALEELLEPVRAATQPVTEDIVDGLLRGIDELTATLAFAAAPPPEGETVTVAAAEPRAGSVTVATERLDELVRLASETVAAQLRVHRVFEERVGGDPVAMAEFHELSQSLAALQQRILQARMVPIATVSDQLHRAVRDLAKALGKDVKWEVEGGDTELDRGVLHHLGDSLLHLVRNAVDHGIETPGERVAAGKPPDATLRLRATQTGSELVIAVEDDGRGIDVAAVRRAAARRGVPVSSGDEDGLQLVFTPGLSTAGAVSAVSGRGVGLDAVRTAIEAVNGRIELESDVSRGTTFRLIVPVSLAVTPCLIVRAGADVFAVPMHRVLRAQSGPEVHVTHAEGREVIWHDERPVALASLAAVVGVAGDGPADGPVVVLAGSTRRYAFRVDALVGRRDLLAKGLGAHLPKSEVVSGATVAADGSVLLVLDIDGLIERARRTVGVVESAPADTVAPARGSLLVVDDAMTIRELQRAILERSGFRVRTAANGEDALAQLRSEPADLVLTDVEMPVMDGFELTSAIRSDPVLAHTPVLILTSLSAEADRQRGLDAGADGYIVKSGFDEKALVDAVDALLGTAA